MSFLKPLKQPSFLKFLYGLSYIDSFTGQCICIKEVNLEEVSEEIRKEFTEVKEILSKTAAEFERAINKLINSTLYL